MTLYTVHEPRPLWPFPTAKGFADIKLYTDEEETLANGPVRTPFPAKLRGVSSRYGCMLVLE